MIVQPTASYDNPYHHDNVYGHVVALLSQNMPRQDSGVIHLDIGCGYARIAAPLSEAIGAAYVGVDGDDTSLASAAERNLETHRVWLSDEDQTYAALRNVVGERRVCSITMLDTLEHLADGDGVLRALRRLGAEHTAYVVISVPNVTHADIGLKLAFGQWRYTDVGLLDHTHLRLFSRATLEDVLSAAGLHTIGTNDVRLAASDQHFPQDHPALAGGTALHALLADLRSGVDDTADVYQFVRLCLPGPQSGNPGYVQQREAERPFLSIVTRTQGTRLHTLTEVFTCLAGQTDTDFEVLVVGHCLTLDRQRAVERCIEDSPAWLRERIRLLKVDKGNRTHPINVGFAQAAGRYISILDDDDVPMAHWVETFKALAAAKPGRLLRAVPVRQTVRTVRVQGGVGLRAEGSPEMIYPSQFDFLQHLRENFSPPVGVAFPRGMFHDFNMQFDETLSTTEDWDYIMRVAAVTGVAASETITSVYRWWRDDECSRTLHPAAEWHHNHRRIFDKMDTATVLFPQGTTATIRTLLNEVDRLRGALRDAGHPPSASVLPVARRSAADGGRKLEQLRLIQNLLTSTSWRATAPLRLIARMAGKPDLDRDTLWDLTEQEAADLLLRLRQSTSWRLSRPLRRLRGFSDE